MTVRTCLRWWSLTAVAALAMGSFAVSFASAALPKTKTNLIVPGKSIAGLRLGVPMNQAKKIWKDPDGPQLCAIIRYINPSGSGLVDYQRCAFELAPSGANYHTGHVYFLGRSQANTVVIGVRAPNRGTKQDFSSKMNRYKTKEGISIGSSLAKLKSVYRNLKKLSSSNGYSLYKVKGAAGSSTVFNLYGSRVYGIEIQSSKAP